MENTKELYLTEISLGDILKQVYPNSFILSQKLFLVLKWTM